MGLVHVLCVPAIASARIHHFIQMYDPRITSVLKKLFKISLEDTRMEDDGLAIKMSTNTIVETTSLGTAGDGL